nr:MAG TPA: hypothetical protein [Caudoviricetes sp.]
MTRCKLALAPSQVPAMLLHMTNTEKLLFCTLKW